MQQSNPGLAHRPRPLMRSNASTRGKISLALAFTASAVGTSITAAFAPVTGHCHDQLDSLSPSSFFAPKRRIQFRHEQILDYPVKSGTALYVSELHIPGYARTKLPFIIDTSEGDNNYGGLTSTVTRIQERTYTAQQDYTSLIPHKNGHLIHRTTIPIFSREECQSIVDEAEHKATQMGWTTNRHGNYPTTDIPIVELPYTLNFFKLALAERIYPLLREQFGGYLPDGGKNLRVADGFIVKYDALGGQTELKPHRDGSVLSFNIALNPATDFDGGGTWFASLDDAVKIDMGEVASHSSSLLHGGHGITSGIIIL